MEYEEEIVAIKREVSKLKSQNVNILIALGHSGFTKDIEIAKKVEDLDLVIGGHSNTFLLNKKTNEIPEVPEGPYPVMITQESGRKVPVVQAYAYTKYMGRLHLLFDSKGEIVKMDGEPILLDQEIPKDPELLKLVDKYRDNVYKISNEVVGVSGTGLNGTCRLRECNMGDFITDAVLNYTNEYYSQNHTKLSIAVVQGGRIRASIDQEKKPFEITRGDWITVLPFADTLTIISMNGKVLLQALEHSVHRWRTIDSTGEFLQVSGIKVKYDLSKAAGNRVVWAEAICSSCNSQMQPIKPNLEYKVIMPQFIADGGDEFEMFAKLPGEGLPYDEITCVLSYLGKFQTINPKLSDRIKIINEPDIVALGITNPNAAIAIGYNLYYLLCLVIMIL